MVDTLVGQSLRFCLANFTLKLFEVKSNGMYIGSEFHFFLTFCQEASGIVNCLYNPERKVDWAKKEKSAK